MHPNRKAGLGRSTLLSRLKRDQRGNVLAIVAASIIPIVGAIGGGVDLTRAYMAEARLTQACDASALAGRKLMRDADVGAGGAITSGTTTDLEIQKFISYNFAAGQFGTGAITRTAVVDPEGELRITLATAMPTAMLQIVGVPSIAIAADCYARRSGVNVDVVLVLDITGSMAWNFSGSNDGSNGRIIALRAATGNFLEILDNLRTQLAPSGMRVRVGIVPYATAVNVGHDLLAQPDGANYIETTAARYNSSMRGICRAAAANGFCGQGGSNVNKYYHNSQGSWTGTQFSGEAGRVTLNVSSYVTLGGSNAGNAAYGWRGCVEARQTVQSITGSETDFSSIPAGAWDIIDTAPGVDGAPKFQPYLFLPQYTDDSNTPQYTTGSNFYGPPTPGQSTSPMWTMVAPHSADKVPYRVRTGVTTLQSATGHGNASNNTYTANPESTDGPNVYCGGRVKLLDEYAANSLTSYLALLKPAGNTFHDVGMYWGLALISPQAPFAHPNTYIKPGFPGTARAVARYIVFMTDGDINASGSSYSAYGYEYRPSAAGNNVTSTRATLPNAQHRVRFRMLCEDAKSQGIEISTVAFSTSISSADRTALQNCATSLDQYYTADTGAALNSAFERIAQNIGYLRVSR